MRFNKNERWGLTIWSVVILMISFGFTNFNYLTSNDHNSNKIQEYLSSLDSIVAMENEQTQSSFNLVAFDPNKISSYQLEEMGLPSHLANRWVKFRDVIGRYNDFSDVKKIYGLDSSLFIRLQPYMKFTDPATQTHIKRPVKKNSKISNTHNSYPKSKNLEHKPIEKDKPIELNTCSMEDLEGLGFTNRIARRIVSYREKVSPYYNYRDLYKIYDIDTQFVDQLKPKIQIKQEQLSKLDINKATTGELKELPGIGDVYSKRIIEFRDQIGSFQSVDQLLDVYGIEDELLDMLSNRITAQPGIIKKVRVNYASKEELARHPYINWEMAKRIANYRKHHFPLRSLNGMIGIDPFMLQKLKPYLTYEIDQIQDE